MDSPTPKSNLIKNIYLYLVSFVALMMVVFSTADIINTVLRTYVFTKADQTYYYNAPCVAPTGNMDEKLPVDCEKQRALDIKQNQDNMVAQRQRDLVRDISFIVVGIPLFAFHWRIIRRKEM